MMLFCMKVMFKGGKKDCHKKQVSPQNVDIKSLQMQVQQNQNMKVKEEMKLF